jgi:hypothetical protein
LFSADVGTGGGGADAARDVALKFLQPAISNTLNNVTNSL